MSRSRSERQRECQAVTSRCAQLINRLTFHHQGAQAHELWSEYDALMDDVEELRERTAA